MKQFNVTGMSCAACSARVEKAVSKVPGVTACSVSLLTNSMGVEGTAADDAVIAAMADGLSNKTIAQTLTLSVRTVENHIYHACTSLGVNNRAELARLMAEFGTAETQPQAAAGAPRRG